MTSSSSASLKHVSFLSADVDAVIAFYTLLGAAVEKDLQTAEGFRRVVLGFDGGKLQFFEAAGEVPRPHPAWQEHIALHLHDLKGSVGLLKQRGTTFSRELGLSPSGNPMAFVLDPDGRQVELLQR
ncbi:lactoylglutathione lyase [Deinococcus irradiatisoli]|uniref:Lactoylglutathione lyase n=1 Tax=Deinococcus irradiatisoli TaxID=2202254 RepID=A0A2Z3JHL8_9DEIO|nr:VOC family protein [Deinococcus irradiatisoli]AWN22870.1 lactoylglutathione lyase [Deinococcus irradiatisoli]